MAKLLPVLFAFTLVASARGGSDAGDAVTQPDPDRQPTSMAAIVPVAERLPADPDAPAEAWVAGVNAAGWDFHRELEGNAVSSPISIGTALSLARAGASSETGVVLDGIFGFPAADPHGAANAVDLAVSAASVDPTTLEI